MDRNAKIYVAGHDGLVGSAITRNFRSKGYDNFVFSPFPEYDLREQSQVREFFRNNRPEYVFLAAAKVGGIHANNTYPAEFIYDNLMIESNIINAAYENKVKKMLFLGSSCIYPKLAEQPLKEEYLLNGKLEPTNEPYALAKIAGIKMCNAYNRQYGTDFISVMPTNLYGIGDNFNLENSHVLPALIRKFHEAKINSSKVTLWGSGSPLREFLFVDDLADAVVFLMEKRSNSEIGEFVNIGTGKDVTIKELAETVKAVTGFQGEVVWDKSKPDGTPRKLLDVSRLEALGWKYKTELEEGLQKTYNWFLENINNIRK